MSIILFIVILLLLILVHELGHFSAAKFFKIRVDEFGIGLPPKAKTLWKKGETEYTLNWLPFGGFVRIFGENPSKASVSGPDKARSFVHKPKWVQSIVLVAGVAFNILLAWILFSMMFMLGTDFAIDRDEVESATDVRLVISSVLPESPAEDVNLKPGDIITSMTVEDTALENLYPQDAVDFIGANTNKTISLSVERGDEALQVALLPETGLVPDEPERAILGISMGLIGFIQHSNPVTALWEGLVFTYDMTILIWNGLMSFFGSLFTLSADFNDVAGPIGIVSVVGEAVALGLTTLLFLTAVISINLAIINILPIPALDGGRLLFVIIEAIKGSPINHEIANRVHAAFFVLLIGLIVIVSYFDIARLIN